MKKITYLLLGMAVGSLVTTVLYHRLREATGHLNLREGTKRSPLDHSLGESDLSSMLSEDAPETSEGIKMRPFPHELVRPPLEEHR